MPKYMYSAFGFSFMLFTLLFGACAAIAPTPDYNDLSIQKKNEYPKSRSDKGLVYIYRPDVFKGSGVLLYIWDNEEIIGGLKSGTYFYYWADEGEHVFWSETEDKASVLIDVKKGHTYYLLIQIGMGALVGVPKFAIEPITIGEDKVKELKYVILNNDLKQLTKDYKSGKLWDEKHNRENRRTPNM